MSKQIKPFETWVIRNRETGEYFTALSGKQTWKAKNHAANAWANSFRELKYGDTNNLKYTCNKYGVQPVLEHRYNGNQWVFPKFKEQDTWECVNISDNSLSERLGIAENLLKKILEDERSEFRKLCICSAIEEYFNE